MRAALSSYTYTWEIGVPGYAPPQPLGLRELIHRTHQLGVSVLQVADNLPLDALSDGDLHDIAAGAHAVGVDIEVGTRGIDDEHLLRYIEIARVVGSPLVRIVIDRGGDRPTPADAFSRLRGLEADFRNAGLTLAIENHDRFSVKELAGLVEGLGDWTGICLDTVNSFGALEGPEVVVATLGPLAVNLHIKDFAIRRADHAMGFTVEGRPVGSGALNVRWLLDRIEEYGRVRTGVIELWTPPEPTIAATVAKERRWARESIDYLRTHTALID